MTTKDLEKEIEKLEKIMCRVCKSKEGCKKGRGATHLCPLYHFEEIKKRWLADRQSCEKEIDDAKEIIKNKQRVIDKLNVSTEAWQKRIEKAESNLSRIEKEVEYKAEVVPCPYCVQKYDRGCTFCNGDKMVSLIRTPNILAIVRKEAKGGIAWMKRNY